MPSTNEDRVWCLVCQGGDEISEPVLVQDNLTEAQARQLADSSPRSMWAGIMAWPRANYDAWHKQRDWLWDVTHGKAAQKMVMLSNPTGPSDAWEWPLQKRTEYDDGSTHRAFSDSFMGLRCAWVSERHGNCPEPVAWAVNLNDREIWLCERCYQNVKAGAFGPQCHISAEIPIRWCTILPAVDKK